MHQNQKIHIATKDLIFTENFTGQERATGVYSKQLHGMIRRLVKGKGQQQQIYNEPKNLDLLQNTTLPKIMRKSS